ncbi:MAG: hypothetical protein AB1634_08115 [Thermodesulfobacteriota bacterium]
MAHLSDDVASSRCKAWAWLGLGLVLAATCLAACGRSGVQYLYLGRGLVEGAPAGDPRADVQMQSFVEPAADGEIQVGVQSFSSGGQVTLKVGRGQLASVLDRLVQSRLEADGLVFRTGGTWDGTMDGLARQGWPPEIIVRGTVDRYWVDAQTGLTGTRIRTELAMTLEVGLVRERAVIQKQVRIEQDLFKVSGTVETIDEVADLALKEGAKEAAAMMLRVLAEQRPGRVGR